MNVDALIGRVRGILLEPRNEWGVISGETTTVPDLYRNYVLILAAIPAVFGFVKGSLIGIDVPMLGTMRTGIGAGLSGMIIGYALGLAQVYVVAAIIDALAPTFAGQKNTTRAFMVAAYAFTAAWVAGVGQIVPWLGWLIGLAGGVYSIYLLYLGLPVMMKCPQDKALGYTAVTVVVAIVVSIVINVVVGVVVGISAPEQLKGADTTFEQGSPGAQLEEWTKRMEAASEQLDTAQQSGDAKAQSEALGAMIGAALGGGQVEALAPDRLRGFVPDTLAGLRRTGVSAERNAAMGVQIAEARATYSDGGGRTLELEITDTGSAKGLMALAGFASVEAEEQTDSGFDRTYQDDGRLVHEAWDNAGHGEYSVVVGERFTVKVSGEADSFDALKDAVGEIDLDGLEDLKDEGVEGG